MSLMNKSPAYCALITLLLVINPAVDVVADDKQPGLAKSEAATSNDILPITEMNIIDSDLSLVGTGPSIKDYEKLIDELEGSGGVYQVQLSEVLLGLGLAYRSLNQHTDAIAVLKRSLHITRVNDGLYSIDQLPILEQMIQTNTDLEDWESLDQNYQYLYWINRRIHGENDLELLSVIDRVGSWHINAYNLDADKTPFKHLIDADNLFAHAIEIIDKQNNPYDPRLINPLYGVALTNYQMATHVSSDFDFEEIKFSSRRSSRYRQLIEEQQARQDIIHASYVTGKKAMIRILDIYANNPELPPDSHAIALVHTADWYMLFNKRNIAIRTYEQAYALLNESAADIDKLFGQPRTLPAITLPITYKKEKTEKHGTVIASFDVSETGRARNIQIIESDPAESISLRRRAKKSIATSRFRPRFENGSPVKTTNVTIRYIFNE